MKEVNLPEKTPETLEKLVDEQLGRNAFLKLAGFGFFTIAASSLPALIEAAIPKKKIKKKRLGMVIDLKRCICCKSCTMACKLENKTPPGVMYNPVLEKEIGKFPNVQRKWFPRPCFHCEKPKCLAACPYKAIRKRHDGIIYIDYEECQGVKKCIKACPYETPRFDSGKNYPAQATEYGKIPSPEFHGAYGLREADEDPIGGARKCTFCMHLQDENGNYTRPPACAETCMGRAIHFGDFLDGNCIVHRDSLSELLAKRKTIRLKLDAGTQPNVYYAL